MAAVPDGSSKEDKRDPSVIALFDVDGTLTEPRKRADPKMLQFLRDLRKKMYIGMVGGSDLVKQKQQLGDDVVDMFDYVFAENGLRAYKNGALLAERTIKDELGEDNLKAFVNYTLKYLADVEIPVKRGTFIEFRTGMLNVSPVGRNCSQEERDAFEKYDAEHGIRKDMVKALEGEFGEKLNLKFSVGGQISFDVFPKGWDKTYCLQFVKRDGFKTIHFFGDKTYEGGNDHEIFASDETEGHTVVGPEDTLKQCGEIFG